MVNYNMEKSIAKLEKNTLYAVTEHLQDVLAYIILDQDENSADCLILLPSNTVHQRLPLDTLFTMLDNNKIEKVETLTKKIIKELKEKHCK
jgi:hypothetical protein